MSVAVFVLVLTWSCITISSVLLRISMVPSIVHAFVTHRYVKIHYHMFEIIAVVSSNIFCVIGAP